MLRNTAMRLDGVRFQIVDQMETGDGQTAAIDLARRKSAQAVVMDRIHRTRLGMFDLEDEGPPRFAQQVLDFTARRRHACLCCAQGRVGSLADRGQGRAAITWPLRSSRRAATVSRYARSHCGDRRADRRYKRR